MANRSLALPSSSSSSSPGLIEEAGAAEAKKKSRRRKRKRRIEGEEEEGEGEEERGTGREQEGGDQVTTTAPLHHEGVVTSSPSPPSVRRFIVFVGNLPYRVKKEDVEGMFKSMNVTAIRMPTEKESDNQSHNTTQHPPPPRCDNRCLSCLLISASLCVCCVCVCVCVCDGDGDGDEGITSPRGSLLSSSAMRNR
jgi:hypothetical protein